MIRGETICIDSRVLWENQNIESLAARSSNAINQKAYDEIEFYETLIPVYDAEPCHSFNLGISVESDGCNIAIWADSAQLVDVCVFDKQNRNETTERWRLTKNNGHEKDIFSGFIPGMKVGDIYGLRVHGENEPLNQQNHDYNKLLVDPYARAIIGELDTSHHDKIKSQWNDQANAIIDKANDSAPYVPRCVVVDELYDWGDDKRPNIPKNEMILYEGHVKGLTYQNEAIPERQRGTYAGIVSEPFLNHLKSLGITSLELLPVQHFVSESHLQSMELSNYWGYNTLGFFAPHAEYSSAGQYGEQVKEFKDMVNKLHASGIEVILDVVYNHTPEGSEQGPTVSFKGLSEQDMYHLSREGMHCNYSGCGNTINASSNKGMDFILDSLRYWAEEMHVDGFRFDLATVLARERPYGSINMNGRFMSAINSDPVLSKLKLIAEPWDCGDYRLGQFDNHWQEWNDQFRDTIRDFWRGQGNLGRLATYLACGSLSSEKSINFITAHDGFTLKDLVSYDYKHNYSNGEYNNDGTNNNHSCNFGSEGPTDSSDINYRRTKAMRNMLLSLFIASGTPMLSHGDEIMRTQNGNNNAYCQDNEITWVDWTLSKEQRDLCRYVSGLINLRKNHPIITTPFTGKPINGLGSELDLAWLRSDGSEFAYDDYSWKDQRKILGMFMSNAVLDDCLIYYVNGSESEQMIKLPNHPPYSGEYEVIVDTAAGEVITEGDGITVEVDSFALQALSAVVMRRKCKIPSK